MTSPSSSSSSPPSGDDWQNHLTVLDSNRFMLENQLDCDVSFVLLPPGGESVNIGAHRYPLICRSPVFFAMFSGPLANNNGEKEIRITDIAPVTFWQLLRYIYYEDVDLSEDNVFPVLYAAKKYLVTSLSRKCIDFLSSILSPENACAFVENSFLFEEDDTSLRKNCLDVIRRHSRRVFHSETFYQASRETLCQVLRMDRLNVHEVDVFRAAVHWAERRSSEQNLSPTPNNKRNVLGEALFLIHVPAMSFSEFTKIVLPTRLLTSDEENSVFRLMLDRETAAHAQSVPFPQNCRSFVATRCDVVYTGFVRHVSQLASMFQGTPQRSRWSMTFYCDHSIKVQEIGVFGLMKGQLTITQNGFRKLEISTPTPVQTYQVAEDDVQLDPGPFTISADQPFAYTGEYFSKGMSSSLPLINSDNDRVNVSVRESSCLCFLSHVIFSPTDELHFIDNYYNEDSESSSFDG